jgi:lipoate-protein ligase A
MAEMARGSYKQPGGKLISASVAVDAEERIAAVVFDGDYFAERADGRDASLAAVADSLVGMSVRSSLECFEKVLGHAMPADLDLVGADAHGMAFAVTRAASQFEGNLALSNRDEGAAWASVLPDRFPENSAAPHHQIELTPEIIRQRWADLDLHIIDPDVSAKQPFEPALQMALDEVIARRTARGELPTILRFWEWAGPAVILGLNQSVSNEVDMEAARRLGISVVRRVTGGGAMFVEPGNTITYSLTTPLSFVRNLSAKDSYGLCESWVFAALRSIGIAASHEPINDISSPAGKIGGAAQRRYPAPARTPASPSAQSRTQAPGALLHHTTMAYDIDADKMLQVLRVNKEKMADKPVKSAAKRVDPMKSQSGMSRRQIIGAFDGFLHREVEHITSMELPTDVLAEARELAAQKFGTREWTERIL